MKGMQQICKICTELKMRVIFMQFLIFARNIMENWDLDRYRI